MHIIRELYACALRLDPLAAVPRTRFMLPAGRKFFKNIESVYDVCCCSNSLSLACPNTSSRSRPWRRCPSPSAGPSSSPSPRAGRPPRCRRRLAREDASNTAALSHGDVWCAAGVVWAGVGQPRRGKPPPRPSFTARPRAGGYCPPRRLRRWPGRCNRQSSPRYRRDMISSSVVTHNSDRRAPRHPL